MAHFIKKCKVCQVVMAQCRCPSPDKEIQWDVCAKCAKATEPYRMLPEAIEIPIRLYRITEARCTETAVAERSGVRLIMYDVGTDVNFPDGNGKSRLSLAVEKDGRRYILTQRELAAFLDKVSQGVAMSVEQEKSSGRLED